LHGSITFRVGARTREKARVPAVRADAGWSDWEIKLFLGASVRKKRRAVGLYSSVRSQRAESYGQGDERGKYELGRIRNCTHKSDLQIGLGSCPLRSEAD
jgi:hypothetical protein